MSSALQTQPAPIDLDTTLSKTLDSLIELGKGNKHDLHVHLRHMKRHGLIVIAQGCIRFKGRAGFRYADLIDLHSEVMKCLL